MFQNNPYVLNNPYNNYYPQQGYGQMAQPMQQQVQSPLNNYYQSSQLNEVIAGSIVDSEDVVKSKNCALDGSPTYYPLSDKSAIYIKQLNPQTGAGMMFKYKLEVPEEIEQPSVENQVATLLSNFKLEISQEISDLKNIVIGQNSQKEPKDQSKPHNNGGGKW